MMELQEQMAAEIVDDIEADEYYDADYIDYV